MNVAIINIKDIFKYIMRIIITILLIIILISLSNKIKNVKLPDDLLTYCLNKCISLISYKTEIINFQKYDSKNFLALELSVLNNTNKTSNISYEELIPITDSENINIPIENINVKMPKKSSTEQVSERNIPESSTNLYSNVKIKNNSDYTLTNEMLVPDAEIINKKDILIFHTHTSESYTPSESYNYQMTGNYRTIDNNYNMVRVGNELKVYLENKGFNVNHNTTCHDYPAYSGSYSRSLETVQNVLYDTTTEIVIDLHRDALGNGDTYGPTVKIDGKSVAQLMFVIGTDGGGLEHPNWQQNFKVAIKIQEKANEMYPGLFRPIILTNLRYNQHVAKGASIIEVGATANTLDECLLSMQCLANVLEEVCK